MKNKLLAAGCPHGHCETAASAGVTAEVYEAGIAAGWDPTKILAVFQLLVNLSGNKDVQAVIQTILALFKHGPQPA